MKKIIFLSVVLLLLGAGCNKETPVAQIEVEPLDIEGASTISDAEMFKVGVTTTSNVSGFSTYINDSYGISLDFPSSWKIQEYVGPEGVEGIAFDPEILSTQTQYETLDMAPGRVWIYFSSGEAGHESFEKVSLGKEKILVRVLESDCVEPDCPNPWWLNRTSRTYYIEFPLDRKTEQLNHVVFEVQYPIALKSDTKVQQELNKMLDSFEFVSSTVLN